MRFRTILACLALWLGLSAVASAQVIDPTPQFLSATSTDCSAASSCATWSPGAVPAISYTISGTFSATLTFEGTADGLTWVSINVVNVASSANATTTTASGVFSFANSGFLLVRVRCSAYTSGTVRISATRGFATARLFSPVVSSLLVADGSASAPSIARASVTNTGLYFTNNTFQVSLAGTPELSLGFANGHDLALASGGSLAWSSTTNATGAQDVSLLRAGAGKLTLTGTTPMLQFGGATSSFPAIKQNGVGLQFRLADDSGFTSIDLNNASIRGAITASSLLESAIGPTAPSSCGTSPAVTTNNGTAAWVITGGTGGVATGCTTTMPAATTGWNCSITNITQTAAHRADRATVQTASTTTSVTWEYQTVSTGAATAFTASDVFRGVCFGY